MNRRGFLAGMLAAPFVAKAELLMPVQKIYTRDDLADLIYHLEPTHSPLLEQLTQGAGEFGRWWEEF
jgi:hypothetical protein